MSQMKAQVNKLLTTASSAYKPEGFICESYLPSVKFDQYSGLFGKYGKSHLRIENSLSGGRSKYRRVEAIARETTTFLIEGHGLESMVSKQDYKNFSDPFDAEKDEMMGLTTLLFLEKEKLLADTMTSTAVITQNTTLVGSDQFSDFVGSDPIGKAIIARKAILDGCGSMPNVVSMDIAVWNVLRFHPQMLDACGYKYARPGGLSIDELAVALGVKKILIAEARYNSAKEGQADVLAPVWGKHIVFAVAPDSAAIMQNSVGYLVSLNDGSPRKVYTEDAFNPPGAKLILVEDEYDMLISNAACAYLIKDAIA